MHSMVVFSQYAIYLIVPVALVAQKRSSLEEHSEERRQIRER